MITGRRGAVIACLDAGKSRAWNDVLSALGYDVAASVGDALDILPALGASAPSLLLSDAILPGGDAVSVARMIDGAALNLYPHMLFVPFPGMRLPGAEALDQLGAALLDGPVEVRAVLAAVERLDARAHGLSSERAANLASLLDRLGVPGHSGRTMLQNAAALCWRDRSRLHNLRDRVYPDAARPLGKTGVQAERAIRHVIEAAWRTGPIEEQQRIFGDTIDARRGRPTCGEMIAQLADILRWEGRP